MEITPRELRDIEIHSEIRGYSRDEVNDLLERAALAIEASNERISQLQDRLTNAQGEATRTRETEDILHRTLLLAQRAADEAVAEATAKARQLVDDAESHTRQMVEDAEAQANRLVDDAEVEARRKGDDERRRLEQEIVELAGRRDTLLADVEALTRFEADYRERMVRSLESDLSSLRTGSTYAPAAVPDTSEVELPAFASETSAPVPVVEADGPEAPEAGVEAPDAEPAAAEPLVEAAADSDVHEAVPDAHANGSAALATSEVDVRTLFESGSQPAPDSPPEPAAAPDAHEAEPALAGFRPIDLSNDSVDAEILDDDAFFATLRDAVHDEKPLGPRDDDDDLTGEHQFFDQDADRGSFRDVFRRRR